jgi:23S rRNA pseudouridine2605 synthase
VLVNGHAATLGQRVGPRDRVLVDGRPIGVGEASKATPRVLLYHKPAGEIVSRSDPKGRATVFDNLPEVRDARWVVIGRLDFNTSGLLLFTDSGDLANLLMHPRSGLSREYAARVLGQLSEEQRRRLIHGVRLDDGPARFEAVEDAGGTGSNRWYRVILQEGRYREVRRLFHAVGLTVSRLIRVRFGDIELPPRLRQGDCMEMPREQVVALLERLAAGPSGEAQG